MEKGIPGETVSARRQPKWCSSRKWLHQLADAGYAFLVISVLDSPASTPSGCDARYHSQAPVHAHTPLSLFRYVRPCFVDAQIVVG